MRSRTDEMQVIAIDLVDQQPIWFNVAVAKVLPVTRERMILIPLRQRTPVDQPQNHLPQLRHVFAAFLREFHIAAKLRLEYRFSHKIKFPDP